MLKDNEKLVTEKKKLFIEKKNVNWALGIHQS